MMVEDFAPVREVIENHPYRYTVGVGVDVDVVVVVVDVVVVVVDDGRGLCFS